MLDYDLKKINEYVFKIYKEDIFDQGFIYNCLEYKQDVEIQIDEKDRD